jgi:hypothetical protein
VAGRYREAFGSSEDVRSAVGGVRIVKSDKGSCYGNGTVYLNTELMANRTQLENEATIAHELAHRWDAKVLWYHRLGLTLGTIGEPGPTQYAREANYAFAPVDQMAEDWAESVRAYLYPEWLALRAQDKDEQVRIDMWYDEGSSLPHWIEVSMPQLLPGHRQYVEDAFGL